LEFLNYIKFKYRATNYFFSKIRREKYMQNFRNKTLAILIAILLTVSMAASLSQIPNASAHDPPQALTTNAYIAALPNPVGVGQSTLIYMWLNRVYGYYPVGEPAGSINYAAVNNNYRFHNYKLTITDPNGENTTKTWETIQDTTSSQSYSFTPTIVGTYQFTFDFPGQTITTSNGSPISVAVNDTYLPSTATTTLTVQQDPITTYPDSYPLPQEYWTRPIYGENTGWWTISSNWLGTGAPGYGGIAPSFNAGGNGNIYFAGDTVGPLTSHVMWTKMLQMGGIVGGNKFDIQGNAYFEGSAYNQRYQNPIIVNGKIYYNDPIAFTGSNSGPLNCVDLRTGQLIWSRSDMPTLSFALIWDHEDPNQHGVFPAILSTANFARLFDAETGAALFNVTGAPSASGWAMVNGPWGEQLRYVFQNKGTTASPNWVLARWNSTKLWNFGTNPFTNGSLLSPGIINASATPNSVTSVPLSPSNPAYYTNTYIVNGSVNDPTSPQNRFDYSVPIAWRNTMPNSPTIVGVIKDDVMICQNGTLPSQGATFMGSLSFVPYTYFAVSLKPESLGQILWMKNYDPPANNVTVLLAGIDPVNRVFVEDLRETQRFVGYNIDTGAKLWTTEPQTDFDYYGSQASGSLANTFAPGKLISSAMAGIVYCYDTATGELLWTYGNGGAGNSTNSGFQVPGNYPTFVNAITNDVVYLITSEHTVEMPVFKGAMSRAINLTTGAEIWTLSSYVTEFQTTSYAVADGYATWFNSYDNSIYTVGKGPSALTIQAPNAAIELGRSLVITGNVKDTSAGTKQPEQAARFPNGVPLADDAVMGEWMAYVYQQKPLPTNYYGVEVSLDVVDANGNYRNIGTTRTDASGAYSLAWKPNIEGKYTAIATFHGSNAYWPSSSETAFVVDPAATTPAPTDAPVQSAADLYFVPAIAGLFVAIIVVGALLALLLLRKRA
jgi:outer membrane protein assembly factor BamB